MKKLLTLTLLYYFITASHAQQIALTFDDAPMGGRLYTGTQKTDLLIKKLKEAGVQAAFFCISGNINDEGKQRLLKYAQAGHLLANHSHSHLSANRVRPDAYINDFLKADEILHTYPNFRRWYRYPMLHEGNSNSKRDSIRHALWEKNYINGYVTIDNYDFYLQQMFRNAIEQKKKIDTVLLGKLYIEHLWNSILFYDNVGKEVLGRSPKHVLLLHENDLAALFIDQLIKHLRDNGWQIISPDAAYSDPIAQHIPDVLFNGQGRVAAIAREKGVAARNLIQDSEDEEWLENYFKAVKVFE